MPEGGGGESCLWTHVCVMVSRSVSDFLCALPLFPTDKTEPRGSLHCKVAFAQCADHCGAIRVLRRCGALVRALRGLTQPLPPALHFALPLAICVPPPPKHTHFPENLDEAERTLLAVCVC